jgi:hypothetical protein
MSDLTLEERIAMRHKRGRKPVHITSRLPHPQGRDGMWAAIRELRRFGVDDLERKTRAPVDTIHSYLQGLVAAGYVKSERTPRTAKGFSRNVYELVKDCGVEAPRVTRKGKPVVQGQGRESQWRAMRILKEFGQAEIINICRDSNVSVATSEVADYIKHLSQAGYLVTIQTRGPGRPARYRLVPARNSGPLAPQVQRIQQVFDPNLGKVVWPVAES